MPGATFRRRVLIRSDGRNASADVEDDPHRFGADVVVDAGRVLSVAGRALRTPWTTCSLAAGQLTALEGLRVSLSPFDMTRAVDARQHCTHMLDMAALAIVATTDPVQPGRRVYDLAFTVSPRKAATDRREGTLTRDGGEAEPWLIEDWEIVLPKRYRGRRLDRASAWAGEIEDPREREALFVMRHGVLVAGGLRYDLDRLERPSDIGWLENACFAYQTERFDEGRRTTGSSRSFARPEDLLRDIP